VALSASVASATANVKFIIAEDNSLPFFIGSEKLVGVSTAMSTAATDNAAISSLLDAALSKKYDNATITAWRRLMGSSSTLVASAGPALSGEIKCFVGDNGSVVGLQYGSAVVCQSSSRVVNVKIGTNYLSNIKVSIFSFSAKAVSRRCFSRYFRLCLAIALTLSLNSTISVSSSSSFSPSISQVVLGPNAMIAGLQFIVTNGISGTSTSTYCGTKNGLSAYIGRAGKAVGALGGTCSTGTTVGRRRLSQNNNSTSTPGLVGSTFTSIVTPAPQGSNDSPPFSPSTTFTIDGKTVSGGNVTNGTAAGRRLRMRRALLAASLEN
jgi:hypothetical protein